MMLLFLSFELRLGVWLFVMYDSSHAISHKIRLYGLPLQYERKYSYFCVVSIVLGKHQIS